MRFFLAIILSVFLSGAVWAQESKEPTGDQVLELNKKIKENRAKVASCKDSKKDDPECKKAEAELSKMRDERDAMLKNWPEGKGLRKKLRREAAIDRIKARREKAAEQGESNIESDSGVEDSAGPETELPNSQTKE